MVNTHEQAKLELIIRPNIQYHLVNHCQLKCFGCGTKSDSAKPFFNDIVQFEKDIYNLSKFMHFNSFNILGGEPLLHKQIIDFLKITKNSHLADELKITTNGQLLYKQPDEFWKLLDGVVLTLYPNSGVDNDVVLKLTQNKCDEFGVKLKWSLTEEFIQIHTDFKKRDTQKIFDTCKITNDWSCHYFDNGRYYKCIGPIVENNTEDGVEIEQTAIENYLKETTPLKTCYGCLGTSGPKFSHRQV